MKEQTEELKQQKPVEGIHTENKDTALKNQDMLILNEQADKNKENEKIIDDGHKENAEADEKEVRKTVEKNMPGIADKNIEIPNKNPEIPDNNQELPNNNQELLNGGENLNLINIHGEGEDLIVVNAREQDKNAHSSHFLQLVEAAKRGLFGNSKKDFYKLKYIPDNNTLGKEYGKSFKERITAEEREAKQKNKKSRLYQKAENARLLTETIKSTDIASFDALNAVITRQAFRVDEEDYHNLAGFMIPGVEQENRKLVNLYLGKSIRQVGNAFLGQNVREALDIMASRLFAFDVSDIDLRDDTALCNNAERLERLVAQVSAFEHLADKHHYMDSLNEEALLRLNERLSALRSISAYYQVRKDIITDETYKTHYNDELTMDVGAVEGEKKDLAQKLMQSMVLGRTMASFNGVHLSNKIFGGDIKLLSGEMSDYHTYVQDNYGNTPRHRIISEGAYDKKKEHVKSELDRLQTRLRELNAISPIEEQEEIGLEMHEVRDKAALPVQLPKGKKMGFSTWLKNRLMLGWRWFAGLPMFIVGDGLLAQYTGMEAKLTEKSRRKTAQDKRRHDMVPGREGETFREEIIRKDANGEDIDIYSDTRRGPLVWEKITAGDPEDPPEVIIMVQQNKRGSSVSFDGGDMGHAMIALSYSRYNKNTKRKERYQLRMGYYPGGGLVKGTTYGMATGALIAGSVHGEGDGQSYDISRRYQVKPGDINKILREAEKYADKGYGYYKRNCTTFVVDMMKSINLPIANEIQEEEMVFKGVGSLEMETVRGAAGPGIMYMGANAISSRMNKMDLSYHNFGQKLVTKEDLDRFYKTYETAETLPKGYSPGAMGEILRKDDSGDLSAKYKEYSSLDFTKIQEKMTEVVDALWDVTVGLIPEDQRTPEDYKYIEAIRDLKDRDFADLIEEDEEYISPQKCRDYYKTTVKYMKLIKSYLGEKIKTDPRINDLVMRCLSLCEVTLCMVDDFYRGSLELDTKGDAGKLRHNFLYEKKQFVYFDEKNKKHTVKAAAGTIEGYLLAGKTIAEAVLELEKIDKIKEANKRENGEDYNDGDGANHLNNEEEAGANQDEEIEPRSIFKRRADKRELARLNRIRDLAIDFSHANRYLLEKEDFTEKDIEYAFHKLPAMESDTKGKGKIASVCLDEWAPSITYQAVIFEKLFGGVGALELDKVKGEPIAVKRRDLLEKYMVERINANPELFDMIVKYYMKDKLKGVHGADINRKIIDLRHDFFYKLGACCVFPVYKGKLKSADSADMIADIENGEGPLWTLINDKVMKYS